MLTSGLKNEIGIDWHNRIYNLYKDEVNIRNKIVNERDEIIHNLYKLTSIVQDSLRELIGQGSLNINDIDLINKIDIKSEEKQEFMHITLKNDEYNSIFYINFSQEENKVYLENTIKKDDTEKILNITYFRFKNEQWEIAINNQWSDLKFETLMMALSKLD
jgi:hypothetical protein